MTIDNICAALTTAATLEELLEPGGSYVPSLTVTAGNRSRAERIRAEFSRRLADAYDAAQAERGDPRRAYRGGVA